MSDIDEVSPATETVLDSVKNIAALAKDKQYGPAAKATVNLGKMLYNKHLKGKYITVKGKQIPMTLVAIVAVLGLYIITPSCGSDEKVEKPAVSSVAKKEVNTYDKDGLKIHDMRKCEQAACGLLENTSNKKVKKIEYANPNLDNAQLEKLCASKGGGSILNYILGSIIYSFAMSIVGGIVAAIVMIVLAANGPTYKGEDFAKEKFDLDTYEYVMLDTYSKDETKESEYVYYYKEKNKNVCSINIDKLADYKSAEKLSEEFLKYNNEQITDKNEYKYKQQDNFKGTGNEWYVITKGDELRYYFGELDEEVFLITLKSDTNDYSVTSKCFSDAESFIGSLKTR
jgi:hypothetical protein